MIKKLLLAFLVVLTIVNLTVANLPDKPKAAGEFVEVSGKRIHYTETPGRGVPVVMIHGMPGTNLDFQKVVPLLKGLHTVSIDRPGYGWSEGGPLSFQEQVQAVHRIIAKLKLRRVVLVGHSFGGTVSLGVARIYPQDVSKMVLVAPGAGGRRLPAMRTVQAVMIETMQLPVIKQVSNIVFANVMLRVVAGIGADEAFSPNPVDEVYKQRLLAVTMTSGNLKALANDQLEFNSSTAPWIDANVGKITRPAVEIAAREDKLVPIENTRKLAKSLRTVRLIEVSGGHMVPYTHPDVIAREVRRSVQASIAR